MERTSFKEGHFFQGRPLLSKKWPYSAYTLHLPPGLLTRHRFRTTARHILWCSFGFVSRSVCQPTRRFPPTSPSLAGWPGGWWKEGPVLLFLSSPLTAARVEAWLEGLLLRLALAGPAGYFKNAVMLPTVPDLAENTKIKGMEWSGPTPSAFHRACWPSGSGTGGAPTADADCHLFQTSARHAYVWVCICIHLVSECVPTSNFASA